nr:hypothetical protein [Cytophagales bacterium]
MEKTKRFLRIAYLVLANLLPLGLAAQQIHPAHVGFLYPLSTQGTFSPQNINYFSLHALSGISAGERGLAIYGLAGIIKGDAEGLQVAGLLNLTEGSLQGVQIAGLVNRAGAASDGVQVGGLINFNQGTTPVQIGGLYNSSRKVGALEAAGLLNATDSSEGLQVAGLANLTESISGIQVAGLINLADEVNGSQIAGLINRARVVRGVQLAGLINIADSSDYPIGIINLIKTGEKRLGMGIDENMSTMLHFRSGGTKLYGIIGLGTNLRDAQLAYGFESGLGVILLNSGVFRMDMEAFGLFMTDFEGSEYTKSGVRLLPNVRIGHRLYLYGGPSLHFIYDEDHNGNHSSGLEMWKSYRWGGYRSLEAGFTAGLQLRL